MRRATTTVIAAIATIATMIIVIPFGCHWHRLAGNDRNANFLRKADVVEHDRSVWS